jgi:hypothetical protein
VRMAATCVLASILASGVTAHAETDVFMRTVGFALTGSDHADPKVIGDPVHTAASQSKDGNGNRDWSNGLRSNYMATMWCLRKLPNL